jgi:hypothetical protein
LFGPPVELLAAAMVRAWLSQKLPGNSRELRWGGQ